MADTLRNIKPWNERIGRKDGVPDGVIKFAMLEEIAELREELASRPAEVDDEGLPELPPESARASKGKGQFYMKWSETGKDLRGELLLFTAEQYRQGQRDAVAADRARMPDAAEISDAITEACNAAFHSERDSGESDYWRDLGKRFSEWVAPSKTISKECG